MTKSQFLRKPKQVQQIEKRVEKGFSATLKTSLRGKNKNSPSKRSMHKVLKSTIGFGYSRRKRLHNLTRPSFSREVIYQSLYRVAGL
jgi:hypothetical protein